MFVFAAGGLDSLFKQAIKDALPNVIEKNQGAFEMFKEFVEKDLQIGKKNEPAEINSKLLAQLLTSQNPREELKRRLVYELTSASLQMKESNFKNRSIFWI